MDRADVPVDRRSGARHRGTHVLSAYVQYAPYHLRGTTWDAERDRLGAIATHAIAQYAPGFDSSVVAREVITPLDLERTYGLTGGHIFHGEIALDQFFVARPLLGWARYRTPIRQPVPLRIGHASGHGTERALGRARGESDRPRAEKIAPPRRTRSRRGEHGAHADGTTTPAVSSPRSPRDPLCPRGSASLGWRAAQSRPSLRLHRSRRRRPSDRSSAAFLALPSPRRARDAHAFLTAEPHVAGIAARSRCSPNGCATAGASTGASSRSQIVEHDVLLP